MALSIGEHAPDFSMSNHLGETITLQQFRGKNVVLACFPLAWTPV